MRALSKIVTFVFGSLSVAPFAMAQQPAAYPPLPGPPMVRAIKPNSDRAVAQISPGTFVQETAMGDMFAAQAGDFARSRSRNNDVKAFAHQMVKDHAQSLEKLRDAVKRSKTNISLPAALDNDHAELIENLRVLSGPAFDREYMKTQTDDHADTARVLRAYGKDGESPELKQFAADDLPTVEQHLEQARKIASAVSAAQ